MADAAPDVTVENFVLCEWATWDQQQRPTIHGLLSRVEVPRLPYVREVIGVIFDVWGPPDTTVTLRIVVSGPPGAKKFAEPREFELPLDEDGMRGVGATLEQLELTSEGVHSVSVVHEGRVIGSRRFRVKVNSSLSTDTRTAGLDG